MATPNGFTAKIHEYAALGSEASTEELLPIFPLARAIHSTDDILNLFSANEFITQTDLMIRTYQVENKLLP